MHANLEYLRSLLARVHDLNSAAAVLEWDQETYMPPGGVQARAHQLSTLRRLAHEHFTADEIGHLLEELESEVSDLDPASTPAALVRVTRRDYDRAVKLPAELVAEMAEATSLAKQAWQQARQNDEFTRFAPHLERIVELNIRKAEAIGYSEHRYDALLEEFEPGMQTARLEDVFSDLRTELVPIVQSIAGQPAPGDAFLKGFYDREKQEAFGMQLAKAFGYDFERGRQDESAHPFTTTFSISDVRITTRFDEHNLPTALFSTLHEVGHGLYEQGFDRELERTPLADGASLGIHESQSRLWENQVARSLPFWKHYFPQLQETFPEAVGDVSLEQFYRAINRSAPSPIRVEADEVTYNLHIMLRFQLETALLNGAVRVEDLPAVWNDYMDEYLGIRPENDATGVLQDVHWAVGLFGYFPTYALGNLMSAQLFEKASLDLGSIEHDIEEGRFGPLLSWLREHIHCHGRRLTATQILERATGRGLSAESWLDYVRSKYSAIYDGVSG